MWLGPLAPIVITILSANFVWCVLFCAFVSMLSRLSLLLEIGIVVILLLEIGIVVISIVGNRLSVRARSLDRKTVESLFAVFLSAAVRFSPRCSP